MMNYPYHVSIKWVNIEDFRFPSKMNIEAESAYFFEVFYGNQLPLAAKYNIKLKNSPSLELSKRIFYRTIGLEEYDDRLYKIQITKDGQKFGFYMTEGTRDLEKTFKKNHTRLKKDDIVLNSDLYPIWPENKKAETQKILLNLHEQPKQR